MSSVKNISYCEAVNWLEGFIDFERSGLSGLKSERYSPAQFARFLRLIGNPHHSLRLIHIAGTKGKGSTGSLLSSILSSAGYRVGFYCSPHIFDYRERIQINGNWISQNEFAEIMRELKQEWEYMGSPDSRSFRTVFELLTSACFVYFKRQKVDFGIIETGIGGRLDATNVITPILSIITPVGYDHKFLLGESIEEIAYEKAGIIKQYKPVIIAPQEFSQAIEIFVNTAKALNAPLFFARDTVRILSRSVYPEKQKLILEFNGEELIVETSMLGEHQIKNIQTSLAAIKLLRDSGINISNTAIIQGIKNWRVPGRIEILRRKPLLIVDGAHCGLSMRALLKTIKETANPRCCIFLIAMMKDKEPLQLLEPIKHQFPESIVFTHPAPTPRTLHPEEILAIAKSIGLPARAFASTKLALQEASLLLKKGESDALISCGTFYCIAEVKRLLESIW